MSLDWKTWLPAGALGGRIDRLLAEMLRSWSEAWFCNERTGPLGEIAVAARSGFPPGGGRWRSLDEGLALAIPEQAAGRLARIMLEAPPGSAPYSGSDRQVIEQLAAGCIDDLCARLARLARLGPEARWRAGDARPDELAGWLLCDIGVERREPLVRLFIEPGLAARLVKAGLPPSPPTNPLQPVPAGLARQSVGLSAFIGRCELTLADLAGLAEGDVIVLDREVDGAVDLAVDGRPVDGRCTVEQAGAALALRLSQIEFRVNEQ